MTVAPTRPVLRWHGGKWMLAPWIISYFPPHKFYTEAFGGAASVLLRKPRCEAEIYNDLDENVVNLFRVLQSDHMSERLLRLLDVTPFARQEFDLTYQSPPCDQVERARRYIVRSCMGFSTTACTEKWRVGFRAVGLVRGAHAVRDWVGYPDNLIAVINRFRGVLIENISALEILKKHDSEDTLHYVDPPYVHSTRRKGQSSNYRHEMTDIEHCALAVELKALRGGVIISGYSSPLYDFLFSDWTRVERPHLADHGQKRTEVLWINQAAYSRRPIPPEDA